MKMKRITSLLLAAAMTAMFLCGCGSTKKQGVSEPTETGGKKLSVGTISQHAAPAGISVYPVDLRFAEYALIKVPQEVPAEQVTEETPAETQISGDDLSEDQTDDQDHPKTGNPLPDGGKQTVAQTLDVRVYRYEMTDKDKEQPVYQIQAEVTGGKILSGSMLDTGEVKWEAAEKLDAGLSGKIADELQKISSWEPCSQETGYAMDLRLNRYMVLERNVYFTDQNYTVFQLQSYDENGALIKIVKLSDESMVVADGVNTVIWLNGQTVQLQIDEIQAESEEDEQHRQELVSIREKIAQDKWIIIVLSVGAALLLAAVIGLLLIIKKRADGKRKDDEKKPEISNASKVKSVGTLHNIGKRSGQQDSFRVVDCAGGTLAVVADGMGGLSDGDKVSQKIVSTMCADAARIQPGKTENVLCQMVGHANQEVNRMLGSTRQYKAGSTLLAVLVEKGYMQWIAVGDSRIYLYRGGSLIQVNREHIYEAELLEQAINGRISFANAARDPQANRLSSFIGMGELKHVDICLERIKLQQGDRILLMSDGVFNTLSNAEIASVIRHSDDATVAAANLEQRVLQKAAANQDNFTCVILDI